MVYTGAHPEGTRFLMLASWLVVAASGMSGGGMETASPSLGVSGASRLKFLCSYGGRILPRPSDGQLKYVGGDTRVVAVPRSVTFSGKTHQPNPLIHLLFLMLRRLTYGTLWFRLFCWLVLAELREKIASMFRAETVIKYQMASEDLDALVSVTCDEDLHHMLEEYDRLEANCSSCTHPRLRLFLFPIPTPAVTPTFEGSSIAGTPRHHPRPPHLQLAGTALEQRYIDAINGATTATRPPPGLPSPRGLTIVPPIRLSAFADSSAETSPTSTEAIGRDTSQGLASGGPRSPWRHSGGGDGGGGQALKDMHRARRDRKSVV